MNKIIKDAEKDIGNIQEFLFTLRKFFHKNPEISAKYKEFLEEEETLVY
jgi:hypothetical protein